jgi:hypothetical protein
MAAILVSAAPSMVVSATELSFENTHHNSLLEISCRTSPAISILSYMNFSRHNHVGDRPGGTWRKEL